MALADDIRALRDRTLAQLTATHDYLFHTEVAWRLVGVQLTSNPNPTYRNPATGTTTTAQDLSALAVDYSTRHIAEATFLRFYSIFEVFVGDLLRLWLTEFPRGIGGKTFRLEDALDAGSLPALVARAVDHEVAEVTYKSPRKVLEYLERRIGTPLPPAAEIDGLAEAKATRDVLVHSRGVADAEYQAKAGPRARAAAGQRLDIPKPYHQGVWDLLNKLITDLSAAAVAKIP